MRSFRRTLALLCLSAFTLWPCGPGGALDARESAPRRSCPPGATAAARAGRAVVLEGDILAVGAPRTEESEEPLRAGRGAVFVDERTMDDWQRTAVLEVPAQAAGEQFGYSLALSGDTLLDGGDESFAYDVDPRPHGRVAGTRQLEAVLTTAFAMPFTGYRGSVAIDGDVAVVGAALDQGDGDQRYGRAFVFERANGTWSFTTQPPAWTPSREEKFGAAVAVDGDGGGDPLGRPYLRYGL